MTFTLEERKAIYRIARAMVLADGNVDNNEMGALANEMFRIGSNPDELIAFEEGIGEFKPSMAVNVISDFDDEKKKFFCAFLGALIIVDGEIDENEMKLWSLTSHFCGLPTMSVGDAIEYMTKL